MPVIKIPVETVLINYICDKCNKGSRRNNSGQYNNIKRNDLY